MSSRVMLISPTRSTFCGPPLVPPLRSSTAAGGDIAAPLSHCFPCLLCCKPDLQTSSSSSSSDLRRWTGEGQKRSENLMQKMLAIFAFIAFITAYVMSSFQIMLIIYAAGVLLTMLITVPNWPFFNLDQLNWLDPSVAELNLKPDIQPLYSEKRSTKGHRKKKF